MLFTLQPFPGESTPNIVIDGTLVRQQSRLILNYRLAGNTQALVLPLSSPTPQRQDELWQTTCFEFFIGLRGSDCYWEFNLSPAGHWNVYRFTGYRAGMEREAQVLDLPFSLETTATTVTLALEFDLGLLQICDRKLDLSITTVVESLPNNISYWALCHPAEQPDFHDRRGFALTVLPYLDVR